MLPLDQSLNAVQGYFNDTEHISSLCGQNVEFLVLTVLVHALKTKLESINGTDCYQLHFLIPLS